MRRPPKTSREAIRVCVCVRVLRTLRNPRLSLCFQILRAPPLSLVLTVTWPGTESAPWSPVPSPTSRCWSGCEDPAASTRRSVCWLLSLSSLLRTCLSTPSQGPDLQSAVVPPCCWPPEPHAPQAGGKWQDERAAVCRGLPSAQVLRSVARMLPSLLTAPLEQQPLY